MKKLMKIALLCAAAVITFTFASCDKDSNPDPSYKVTFNSQGGSAVADQTVEQGGKVTKPANPTKAGYAFTNWYKEAACTNLWNFNTDVVNANLTLYAGWEQVTTYTVTFHSNGGSAVTAQQVVEGGYATQPIPPTNLPMAFGGWFTDNNTFANAFNFWGTTITANINLYAKWTAVDRDALQALIDDVYNLTLSNYTNESYNAVVAALDEANDTFYNAEATEGEISAAYNALNTALQALVALPHRAPVLIDYAPEPVDGIIYLTPGETFYFSAYARDAQYNDATNNNVVFQFSAPSWMTEMNTTPNSFNVLISGSAPVGTTVALTVRSAEDPSVSLSVTLKVAAVGELKAQFIAAVNALPAPASITYSHGTAIEAASTLYWGFLTWDEKQEPAVVAAYEKLKACEDALYDLPERIKYTFSGNTATFKFMNWDDTLDEEDTLTLSYVQDGSFPCGTYTQVGWYYDKGDDYYQVKLVLKADGTCETYEREATSDSGANASAWALEDTGTYTNQGTKAAGGILFLSFDYDDDNPDPSPMAFKTASKPVRSHSILR